MSEWPQGRGELAGRIRAHDWAATPLGAIAGWSTGLRMTVDLTLGSPVATILLWGPDRIQVYNDPWALLMGDKHPAALGQPTAACFPEITDIMAPLYDRVERGEAVILQNRLLPIDRRGGVQSAWWTAHYLPVRDENGSVAGMLCTVMETTTSVLAEQEREAELARTQRMAGIGSIDVDLVGNYISRRSPEYLRLHGLAPDTGEETHDDWRARVHPDDRDRAERVLFAALDGTGPGYDSEYRIIRPSDGETRWIHARADIERDADGQALRLVGAHIDITDQKRTQEELRKSEERLRSAVEVGHLGLWSWNLETGEVHWSDEHFRMEGYAVGEVAPSYETWAARIHPDDRAGTEAALAHAMATGEDYQREFRIVHPDGSVHWLHGRGRFFYEGGRPVRMVGAMIETTERREWEERQKALVAELQHRTRNLIGVVRSLADKTARASADLPDFHARFRDRLEAVSRVQGLLSRLNQVERVTFDELIRAEIAATAGHSDRVTLDGPSGVRLRSSTVQTLAMALHELATNAVAHGALRQPAGHLTVTWSLEQEGDGDEPWLHIDWRERGVSMPPPGSSARGMGQGRELIEQALPYQLRAKTAYALEADGVHCAISLPVSVSTLGENGKFEVEEDDWAWPTDS